MKFLEQKPKTEQKLTGNQFSFTCRNKHTKEVARDLREYMKSEECEKNRSKTEIDYKTRVFLDPQGAMCEKYCALVKRTFMNFHPDDLRS